MQQTPLPQASTADNPAMVTADLATMDDDLSELLGEDPSKSTEYGMDIHDELSKRLEHIIVQGLDSDKRKELITKYLCPANCKRIIPPLLNPEIKAALPDLSVKRDRGIENRQKQIGVAISCLSQMITTKLSEKDRSQAFINPLMDAIRLLSDTFHSDSTKRRYFALSSLKKDLNEHLTQTKIDQYLFGEGLAETLKAAKAVTRSGDEIKVNYANSKKTVQPQPSTSRGGLNWKAPPPARRQQGVLRSQQTYQPAGQRMTRPPMPPPPPARRPPPQHANSSRTSQYQPRLGRRY